MINHRSLNKRIALESLTRTFDPTAPMFIEYGDHLAGDAEPMRTAVKIAR